jgi:hypothetical protein
MTRSTNYEAPRYIIILQTPVTSSKLKSYEMTLLSFVVSQSWFVIRHCLIHLWGHVIININIIFKYEFEGFY